MKKIVLGVFGLVSINTFAQAPNWAWAKGVGGNSSSGESGYGIAVDVNGNSYVTGYFSDSTITFGSITLYNDTTDGSTDIFIVKYNTYGTVIWAKSAGGIGFDEGNAIAVDASGDSYITGRCQGSFITFGSIILTNPGMFIAKYDVNGNVVWAKSTGGNSNAYDYGNSIALDANGNSYVTGAFGSSSITFGSTTLTNAGIEDIFTVKYDVSGNVIWAKSAGGNNGDDWGFGITVDTSGNSYVTGTFKSSTITFGSTTLSNASIAGYDDMFIVKYDTSGTVIWAKVMGGSNDEAGSGIATDVNGNIYVTGYFYSSTITFGSIILTNANAGIGDMFIVKYDASGTAVWAEVAGTNNIIWGISIAVDATGNSYITGIYGGTITLGSTILNNNGAWDIFIAKYSASGSSIWAKAAGGIGQDKSYSIAVDASGNIYTTGYFLSSSIIFGGTTLTGSYDMFVAKLGTNVGIKEETKDFGINIYPNPFISQTTITISDEKPHSIKVMDVLGCEILRFALNDKSTTINMSDVAKGIYFVSIQSEKGVINRKIIKE